MDGMMQSNQKIIIIYICHNKRSLDTTELYISSLNPDLGSAEMRVSSNVNIAEPKEPFVFWKTFILQLLTVFVKHDFQCLITAVRLTKFWLFVLHTRGRRAAAPRPRPFPSGR